MRLEPAPPILPTALPCYHLDAHPTSHPTSRYGRWVSIFGSAVQANYVSANAYLDCLAVKLRMSSRCGCSLQLPPVSGHGMSASFFASESAGLQEFLSISGMSLDEFAAYLLDVMCALTAHADLSTIQSPLPTEARQLNQIVPNPFTPLLSELSRFAIPFSGRNSASSINVVATRVGEVGHVEAKGVVTEGVDG